ncbi:hypothetical protein IIB79_08510 [candidate division KSB1 bacterium]|nr:hypothetical protein [candidate division KSB1 bacterium]
MDFNFTKSDIKKISKTLGVEPVEEGEKIRYVLKNNTGERKLSLEIYKQIPIGNDKGNLIAVYTDNTHLQLQYCLGFVASDSLGEVTFIAENGDKLCGLTIEKQAACSLYANVDKKLLSGDFTTLGPEVMLSGIGLSLVEELL